MFNGGSDVNLFWRLLIVYNNAKILWRSTSNCFGPDIKSYRFLTNHTKIINLFYGIVKTFSCRLSVKDPNLSKSINYSTQLCLVMVKRIELPRCASLLTKSQLLC